MPKRTAQSSRKNDERFRKVFIYLIGVAFVIVGINGLVRTYCLSLPGTTHPNLVRACISFTTPGQYLADATTIIIGLVIIFLEGILNWLADNKS